MYRDFTLVDTQNRPFNWKITFARTLRRFRSAVHRYAVHIRHFRAHRRFTSQPQQVPDESLKMFETLVTFEKPEYSFQLTQAFVKAIDAAEADARESTTPAPQRQRHPGGNDGARTPPQPPTGGRGSPAPHKGLGHTYRHRREHRPSPPRGGGAARPPIRGRAHNDTGANSTPAPHGGAGRPGPP